MIKDTVSPEEKLLRLIRGQKKQPNNTQTIKHGIKIPLQDIFTKHRPSFKNSKVLAWILAAAFIYLFVSVLYPFIGLKITVSKTELHKPVDSGSDLKTDLKPFEFYQQSAAGRNIFGNISAQDNTAPASAAGVDLVKDISLVGIIAGENPQAIVEDKKTSKTYYVTKGQFIADMQVDDIQESKIIVNYKGQKYELYL